MTDGRLGLQLSDRLHRAEMAAACGGHDGGHSLAEEVDAGRRQPALVAAHPLEHRRARVAGIVENLHQSAVRVQDDGYVAAGHRVHDLVVRRLQAVSVEAEARTLQRWAE